nr:MAG TPA: hypothetical protein [Bacteriophage sp.]
MLSNIHFFLVKVGFFALIPRMEFVRFCKCSRMNFYKLLIFCGLVH